MKTKKLTRAQKVAQGMTKPAQSKYELRRTKSLMPPPQDN